MKKIDLENIEKIKVPYKVPEAYFDSLTSNIQDRISQPRQRELAPTFRWRWAIIPAMMTLIIVTIIWTPQSINQEAKMDELLDEVSNEDIESYLSFTNISEYEIATIIESTDEIPDTDLSLEGIDIEDEHIQELLLEFNLTNESIDS